MASTALGPGAEANNLRFLALLMGSIVVHATLVWSMNAQPTARASRRPVEMALFEPARLAPTSADVKPPPAPPKRVRATTKLETPQAAAQRPTPSTQPQVPAVGGVTPDSETPIGTFVLPAGNTVFAPAAPGVTPKTGPPSTGSIDAPPGSADVEPMLIGEVKVDYPADARVNEVEGVVRLRVTTDEHGVVTNVVVISGPGYGLDEAARDALKRFTFKPATKGGAAVPATFTYTYRFELN